MGKMTTEAVFAQFAHEVYLQGKGRSTMSGVAYVKSPGGNPFYIGYCEREPHNHHIETFLFGKIKERYNDDTTQVPNNSTIVLVGTWSPCTDCVSTNIPNFMTWLNPQGKNITVKILFFHYWINFDTTQPVPYGRYADADTAQAAYDVLSNHYSTHTGTKVLYDSGPQAPLGSLLHDSITKTKKCLYVQPYHQSTKSTGKVRKHIILSEEGTMFANTYNL